MVVRFFKLFGAVRRNLSPRFRREKRLEQYRETEEHEWMEAVLARRKKRDEKESQIDRDLFAEKREGSNWLETREIRMSAVVLEYRRTGITARIDIRKRLGAECPALLSDAELSKLQDSMLRSLQQSRQARWDDYQRRAQAAGIRPLRLQQRDAAEYGDLEAFVRREVRQLVLARSLRRVGGPRVSRLKSIFKVSPEWIPLIMLIGTILSSAGLAITYLELHKRSR